jgi:ribonuclease HI
MWSFPQASNNEAEYEALLHGMRMAKACEATRLKIFEGHKDNMCAAKKPKIKFGVRFTESILC